MTQLRVDLQGVLGIFLVPAAGAHLEGVAALRIFLPHEGRGCFRQLFKGHEVVDGNRADSPDSKDMGESLRDLFEIKFALCFHENSAVSADHIKMSFTGTQGDPDLTDKRLFKHVAVFSLDTDLGIFDQKSVVSIHYYLLPPS